MIIQYNHIIQYINLIIQYNPINYKSYYPFKFHCTPTGIPWKVTRTVGLPDGRRNERRRSPRGA